jgi:hypothetical protein
MPQKYREKKASGLWKKKVPGKKNIPGRGGKKMPGRLTQRGERGPASVFISAEAQASGRALHNS